MSSVQITATRLGGIERLRDDNPGLFKKLLLILMKPPSYGKVELHFQGDNWTLVKVEETHR